MNRQLLRARIGRWVHRGDRVVRVLARGRVPSARCVVLCYHAVPPGSRDAFLRQLDLLRRVATPVAVSFTHAWEPGRRYVAVTFDDGFESVAGQAAAALTERAIPYAVFVPSAYLGRAEGWVRDRARPGAGERVMDAATLAQLYRETGMTLGSHTRTHADLVRAGEALIEEELAGSRRELEAAVGVPAPVFSFPFGSATPALIARALAAYDRVFTSEPRRAAAADRVVGRVGVDPMDSEADFRAKLDGAYRWLAAWHDVRRRVTRA